MGIHLKDEQQILYIYIEQNIQQNHQLIAITKQGYIISKAKLSLNTCQDIRFRSMHQVHRPKTNIPKKNVLKIGPQKISHK